MSQENVEIVRRLLHGLQPRRLDRYFACCDPEIEFHDTPGFPGGRGPSRA